MMPRDLHEASEIQEEGQQVSINQPSDISKFLLQEDDYE